MKRFLTGGVLLTMMYGCLAASAFAIQENNVIKIYKDVEVAKGTVVNDVVVIGGSVTVYGRVENGIVAVGGSVSLKPGSYVGEDIVVVGGELARSPDARFDGKVTQVYIPRFMPALATLLQGGWMALWATISLLALIGFIGLAVLLTALVPEHIGTAVNALEKALLPMFLWGILWTILIVPIAVLLAISIVGIVLIPLEILLVVLALVIGYIAAAAFIGKNVLLAFKKLPPPFVDVLLGIVILFLIGFVPVIGALIKVFFLIAGFGAVLTTRFGTIK